MISHNIAVISALVGGIIVGVMITMAAFAVLATWDSHDDIVSEVEDTPIIMPIAELNSRPKQHVYNQESDFSFGGVTFSRKK